tara:strand:+ start:155 stop:295 length:141 start_codon:yes stop_codon:yes gene_type:complete
LGNTVERNRSEIEEGEEMGVVPGEIGAQDVDVNLASSENIDEVQLH